MDSFTDDLRHLDPSLCTQSFAQQLYGALCNTGWKHEATNRGFSCSWRTAGAIAADVAGQGEMYLDYYCGGNEEEITSTVEQVLGSLGWTPCPLEEAYRLQQLVV